MDPSARRLLGGICKISKLVELLTKSNAGEYGGKKGRLKGSHLAVKVEGRVDEQFEVTGKNLTGREE
jgi:hypothetical protein